MKEEKLDNYDDQSYLQKKSFNRIHKLIITSVNDMEEPNSCSAFSETPSRYATLLFLQINQ